MEKILVGLNCLWHNLIVCNNISMGDTDSNEKLLILYKKGGCWGSKVKMLKNCLKVKQVTKRPPMLKILMQKFLVGLNCLWHNLIVYDSIYGRYLYLYLVAFMPAIKRVLCILK